MDTKTNNTLVIGGPNSLKGKPGFDWVGSDYVSLCSANGKRALSNYQYVLFWPTEKTFDFATSFSAWQRACKETETLPEFTQEQWAQLHQQTDPGTITWDGSIQRQKHDITSRCHQLFRNVRDAMIEGTVVVVVVVDPRVVRDISASELFFGWFCRYIHPVATRSSLNLTECSLDHSVVRAFRSIRSQFSDWSLDFHVKRSFQDDEYSEDLVGEHFWFDHTVNSEISRDQYNDHIRDDLQYQDNLAQRVNVVAGLSNPEGGWKAVLFLAQRGGVIVVPRPQRAVAFVESLCGLRATVDTSTQAELPVFFNSVTSAAAYAHRHPETISAWIKNGWIQCEGYTKSKRIGPGIKIPKSELNRMGIGHSCLSKQPPPPQE